MATNTARAERGVFLPPSEGRDALSRDHTDQGSGMPLWLPRLPLRCWMKLQTDVQMPARLVSQATAHRWAPPRQRGDEGIGAQVLVLDTEWVAPRWLPRLVPPPPPGPPHHGYGRPRRKDTSPELVMYVAWARDVARLTRPQIARLLYADNETHLTWELDRVKRAERDGRERYRFYGALPWAAYADAKPPPEWPTDSAFVEAVRRWQQTA
jgi:hypothetical protein